MGDLHKSTDLPIRSRGWTAYKNDRLQTGCLFDLFECLGNCIRERVNATE